MKTGHIADRKAAADFARFYRARYRAGQVAGGFTYAEWTRQVFIATHNKLALLTKARREAERVPSFAEVDRIATDEAREAFREHSALLRQVDANRRDPALSHLYD